MLTTFQKIGKNTCGRLELLTSIRSSVELLPNYFSCFQKRAFAHFDGCCCPLYVYAHIMDMFSASFISSVDPDQTDPRGAV